MANITICDRCGERVDLHPQTNGSDMIPFTEKNSNGQNVVVSIRLSLQQDRSNGLDHGNAPDLCRRCIAQIILGEPLHATRSGNMTRTGTTRSASPPPGDLTQK